MAYPLEKTLFCIVACCCSFLFAITCRSDSSCKTNPSTNVVPTCVHSCNNSAAFRLRWGASASWSLVLQPPYDFCVVSDVAPRHRDKQKCSRRRAATSGHLTKTTLRNDCEKQDSFVINRNVRFVRNLKQSYRSPWTNVFLCDYD